VLGIVQGPVPDAAYPALGDADEGTPSVLIPADAWGKAFKLGDKSRPVGVGIVEKALVLAVGDQSLTTPEVEGRYPEISAVLPKTGPLVSVRVTPALLIALLKVAETINPEGATLHFYRKGHPLGLSTRNDSGQTFDGLLMPLS
jgi:hypothetical protein